MGTREALISLFEGRTREIKGLRVSFSEKQEPVNLSENPYAKDFLAIRATIEYAYHEGKARYISTTRLGIDSKERKSIQYWDGVLYKKYSPLILQGHISDKKSETMAPSGGPFAAAMIETPGGREVSVNRLLVFAKKATITKTDEGLVVIDSRFGIRVSLDAKKNYLVTRKRTFTGERAGSKRTIISSEFEVLESKEVRPGLWLPVKYVKRYYTTPPAAKEYVGKERGQASYEVTDMEINPEFPPDFFRFEFPKGATVSNAITGKQGNSTLKTR
jgi:hypothetical protein